MPCLLRSTRPTHTHPLLTRAPIHRLTHPPTNPPHIGKLFQPVPYSPGTPHGMPPQFEVFYQNPQYAICHVPPPVMFKARVFTPPRLCAVFEIAGPFRGSGLCRLGVVWGPRSFVARGRSWHCCGRFGFR